MKNSLIVVLCLILCSACSNKADEEKLTINKVQQNTGFFQIIGIGKIIPELDIVFLTSPFNGIVQHLYKKENEGSITPFDEIIRHVSDNKTTIKEVFDLFLQNTDLILSQKDLESPKFMDRRIN
jgi:hypothetical protein